MFKKSRFKLFVISIAVLMLPILGNVDVQAQLSRVASSRFEVDTSQMNTLWFQAINFLNNGDLLEANLKVKEVNVQKFDIGLENLPEYSQVLINKAYELKQQRRIDEAIALVESARLLSPDAPAVYFALARLHFAQDFTGAYRVLRDIGRGLSLQFSDVSNLVVYVNQIAFTLLVTGMLTSAIFIIFSFVYYRRAIFYLLQQKLPGPPPIIFAHIVGWVLIAIVTLGMGVYWGILLLALLLLLQVEAVSKKILQGILFFGAITFVLVVATGLTYSTYDGGYFQALRNISRGEFTSRSAAVLQERLEVYSNDAYALFGLAYMAQKTGKIEEAIEVYENMPFQFPDQAAVQNNLGNMYQFQYRNTEKETWYEQAKEAYNSAIRYAPKMFAPHYNLGQLMLLNPKEGEEGGRYLQKASQIDGNQYTFYSDYLGEKAKIVATSFSTMTLIKRLYAQDALYNGTVVAKHLWKSGSRFTNPLIFSIASGVLFLLSFGLRSKKAGSQKGVVYCQMCADPYTLTRRKSKEHHAAFCTQCTHIFKKKTVVKPEKREAKIKQIELRQRVRGSLAKLSSLIFPGSGQIYFGYNLRGLLFSLCFSLAIVILALKSYWRIFLSTGGKSIFSWPTLILVCLLLGVTYFLNLRDILKLSPKNQ